MKDAALERLQCLAASPSSLRKHDQRIPIIESLKHRRDRVVRAVDGVALYQNSSKHFLDHVAADAVGVPVIGSSYRKRMRSKPWRQRRPKQNEIGVAGMIRDVDASGFGGSAAHPPSLRARDEPRSGDERSGKNVPEHLRSNRFFPSINATIVL
jgi:hypothetical protein